MTPIVIALDMDGVLCEEPQTYVLGKFNEHFGTTYTPEDVTDFGYSFLTHKQREWIFANAWHDADLYDNWPIRLDKQMALDELRDRYRVVAVSSPLTGHIKSKYDWLRKYFDRRDIYLCSDKALVQAHALVDDSLANLKTHPGISVCYDQPWNRSEIHWPRVQSFKELPQTLEYLLEENGIT